MDNNYIRFIYKTEVFLTTGVFICAVVNAAEHKKVDDVSDDVSTQLDTSSVSVSADGSNSVPPSEVETVHPTAAEDRSSIAVAVSETEPAPPTPLVVPLKRKRGRPPLHTRQTSERRHAKLLDVCTCISVTF